jgi:23S rRNA pseudouridine2605 synthase
MAEQGAGPKKVTLDRFFSKRGLASRGTAKAWILSGEVTVNGRICRDPETWVNPDLDVVQHKSQVAVASDFFAVLLYKKRGLVTTHSDEQGRPTVFDDLPKDFPFLHAVGRLDQATSGLLILTNSTMLSSFLTEPKNGVEKIYLATVKGEWDEARSRELESGVSDNGEFLKADRCVLRKKSKKESHLVLTLSEGKNREIRRLTAHFGCPVVKLKRVQFGPLTLEKLQPGEWRKLSKEEIRTAFPRLEF